jgi:hypothetical protein
VRLDDELTGLGHLEAGELLQRRGAAVVLDLQLLDQSGRGAAGAHGAELGLHVLDSRLHRVDGVEERFFSHPNSVPMPRALRSG